MVSMKYNLSKIMKRAWNLFRKTGHVFAQCLHMAWNEAKNKEVAIKKWFFSKIDVDFGWHYFFEGMHRVLKETEKAFLLEIEACTLDGEYDAAKSVWVPKKCTLTEEEFELEEKKNEESLQNGLNYNQELIAFCKANGIKGVRKMMKTKTLLEKIEKAGLVAPAK